MSRPAKEIDWDIVDEKIIQGCPGTEIAACFGMHAETFYDRVKDKYGVGFTVYWQQKHMEGNTCLRGWQWEKAKMGDNTMLIWLGKNRLKQSESPQEHVVSGDIVKKFDSMMSQISSLQSNRTIAESNNNKDK